MRWCEGFKATEGQRKAALRKHPMGGKSRRWVRYEDWTSKVETRSAGYEEGKAELSFKVSDPFRMLDRRGGAVAWYVRFALKDSVDVELKKIYTPDPDHLPLRRGAEAGEWSIRRGGTLRRHALLGPPCPLPGER